MKYPIKVALIDDHVLVRKGLASLLVDNSFRVVLQADNGRHFINQLQKSELPDVALLDISMPVMDGYETARWIKANHPHLRILALSVLDDEDAIIKMLHAGARGYLLKDCEPEELTTAVISVARNGYYNSDLIKSRVIHNWQPDNGQDSDHELPNDILTENEKQFLRLICSDMTYKEIASDMHLSPRTIDGYRDNLFRKLDIKSKVGLVLFAMKHGLVTLDELEKDSGRTQR